MRLVWGHLFLVAALATGYGCGKAKSAIESAAGFAALEDADITGIKTNVQWSDTDPLYANLQILKGFSLQDNFPGDLNQKASIPIPVTIPSQGADKSQDVASLALVKVVKLQIDDKTSYQRLQIVSVARYDATEKALKIDGDIVNQYLDPDQVVSKAKGNQAGTYLLIQGKGNKGLQFLNGTIKLRRDGQTDANAEAVKGAWVFTNGSPFVTQTGSKGMYFLAVLKGSKGNVIAYKGNIPTVGSENPATAAPGTPLSAQKDVSYAGVLDQYKGAFNSKVGEFSKGDSSVTAKASTFFDTVNNKVTDFVNGWKIVTADLMFIQPVQAKPSAPTPAPTSAATNPNFVAAPAAPAATPVAAATGTPIMRRDPNDTSADATTYNVDLGCSGFKEDGKTKIDIVRDGAYFEDYSKYPGWRGKGDVQYAYDFAAALFPAPTGDSGRYLDGATTGYCVITAGDAQYQISGGDTSGNKAFQPQDGMVSELWQKVKVPTSAKSIQFRAAFFTTEFPKFIGSQYNDSFVIKFDESPAVLASGNLNDLAGLNSPTATDADKTAIQNCANYTYAANKGATCGDWMFVADYLDAGGKNINGELWGIGSSSTAPKNGSTMGCLASGSSGTKCYAGMIKPRIICKDLADADKGALRTLRITVADAGDPYFDSALALDSVVFSSNACSDTTSRMTAEPLSRAAQL